MMRLPAVSEDVDDPPVATPIDLTQKDLAPGVSDWPALPPRLSLVATPVTSVRNNPVEAGVAAAHGLGFEQTLRTITIDAAKILGVADRVGSLEVGKDGDIALYDGDPFEYTTHCVGVVINGIVVSQLAR